MLDFLVVNTFLGRVVTLTVSFHDISMPSLFSHFAIPPLQIVTNVSILSVVNQ